MIGNNKIVLNNATMQEAVQLWLDSKTREPIGRVVNVLYRDTVFEVCISEIQVSEVEA